MDKNRLCYLVRSRYPERFGIRRAMQRLKVKRLYRHVLTSEEIAACENDPSLKGETICPYMKKWEKYLLPAVREMEDIFENAPTYSNRTDKDELRADMLFCRLAYGFIPSEYVSFNLEHRTAEERRMFVSDIDMNDFGYSVNNIREVQHILDKADSFLKFSQYFKRDAIIIEKEKDFEQFELFVQKHPAFVKKVVFSSMGKGIERVDSTRLSLPLKDYFNSLIASGKYLMEEIVVQHPEMAKFNPSSVNTIRCFTFKTNRGIEVPWCFMRVGRDGMFVDNGGSGGLLIGIDVKTGGTTTDGIDEYGKRYETHPNTGIRFMDNRIPAWDEMLEFCKIAAAKVDGIGYLSWDMAYTENGWVVIEVNEVGQFIGPQMTMQKGIKAELKEYFDRMEKVI